MRERDDDALARAQERRELALALGQPARGDRGPLRLEREGLRLRERVELRRAGERRQIENTVLFPDAAYVVRLEHEVGRPVEWRREIVGHLNGGCVLFVV